MAVLVEAISVIVRVHTIQHRYPGGWVAFRDAVPNATLACDTEIARVGFMAPVDVKAFIAQLTAKGLTSLFDNKVVDIAVVDQQRGLTRGCDWLEWGRVLIDGNRISACRLAGSKISELATPLGWMFEGSLSQTFSFTPTGQEEKSLEFLGSDGRRDVVFNRLTGCKEYIGRTSDEKLWPFTRPVKRATWSWLTRRRH